MLVLTLAMFAADLPQLDSAYIAIALVNGTAKVTSEYHFRPQAGIVEFVVMRVPGQAILIQPADTREVQELPGLYRIRIPVRERPAETVVVEYEATGRLSRIAIPVPNLPADPRGGGIRIRVTGMPVRAALRDAFPRLARDERSDEVWARPTSIPSFVRLPPAAGPWSVNRLAETSVVTLVLLATAIWLVRRKKRPRNPAR